MSFLELLFDNPLLVESRRFARRFFGVTRLGRATKVLLWLTGTIYIVMLGLAFASRKALSSDGVFYFQSGIFALVVPLLTYGAIAGEKEQRSWDLLAVAPISKAKIVLGKYISSLAAVLAIAVLVSPLLFIAYFFGFASLGQERFMEVVTGEVISLGFGAALAGLCIWISSMATRGITAQALCYGGLVAWMVLLPAISLAALWALQMNSPYAQESAVEGWINATLFANPFYANAVAFRQAGGSSYSGPELGLLYNAGTQLLLYAAVASTSLTLAIRRLNKGDDHDKRRLRRLKHAVR